MPLKQDPLDGELRSVLNKLENIETGSPLSILSSDDIAVLRKQITEGAGLLRDSLERARLSQEELESTRRRRDEAESRLAALETEYEELIGQYPFSPSSVATHSRVLLIRENYKRGRTSSKHATR